VKGFFKNPIIAFLSSLKFSAFLLVVAAVAAGRATFIEKAVGRDGAFDLVYAARWFEIVLGLITLSLVLIFIKRWPYKPRHWGFALVHISIVVILVGAGMTRYFGFEGVMPIREGETVNYIYSDKNHVQASLGDQLASYPVRLWRVGANDIWKKAELQGRQYELGVTEYWPHFTEAYQEGPGGPAGFRFRVVGHQDGEGHMLLQGDQTRIGSADARFVTGDFSDDVSTSRFGDLRVNINGESCAIPVQPGAGAAMTCNGYRFELVEFQPSFQVGGTPDVDGPLTNPMIKVAITAPDGRQGERILFAFHPDFAMDHSGGEDTFADLNLLYQVSRGLEFAVGGETGIQGRASFALATTDMNGAAGESIPAGDVFPLRATVVYKDATGAVGFMPVALMSSVVLAPALSNNPNNRSAARIVIRDADGNEAAAVCVDQDEPRTVDLNGQTFQLAYGPIRKHLPYSIKLDDFVLQTYPGSDNPATYESFVSVYDEELGLQGEKAHIFMNHPLNHRGSKHFQSSYDVDRNGTILSVNHDPGKIPTYLGYMMISLGFILIMAKDLLFPTRKKGAQAAAVLLAFIFGLGGGGAAHAQTADDGHDHAVTSGFVKLSDPAREMASRLIVQDYRGRMKPLDTMAREVVMKVAKRSKFAGREPVDQFLSWSLNPTLWWDEPVIGVRFPGLKNLLGVTPETKHVSAASLFDDQGQYRLADQVQAAHRTPNRDRTKTQRKLISFDERFNILYMCFRGQELALYPVPGDDNQTWLDFQRLQDKLPAAQAADFEAAYSSLLLGVQTGNNAQIIDGLTRTGALQEKYGAAVIPSSTKIEAELFYNKSHIWSWMMIPLLVTFIVLMAVYLVNLFRNRGARLSFRNPFYSFGMFCYVFAFAGMILAYAVRWVASGRIPIANGHESLLFISLAVAMSGLIFELKYRMAAPASLGGLLTTVILGVSMLSTFDPAIGPLVPVLVSYWLNIHVTIITSSYGFLGLSALIGALTLFLLMVKGPGRENVHEAVQTLDNVNKHVVITGLGLLTVGTLLGGVWANESWGRYWGWDAKETWSLITILVYAVVLHFRWISGMRSIWLNASTSLAAIMSVVMTYFGVNYFLAGLHSYAQGDAAQVPSWVHVGAGLIGVLIVVSGLINRSRSWGEPVAR